MRYQMANICWLIEKAKELIKTSTSVSLTMPKSLCGSQQTVENSERDGNTRPPDLPLEKPIYAGQEATVRTSIEHLEPDWFQIGKGVHQGCIL